MSWSLESDTFLLPLGAETLRVRVGHGIVRLTLATKELTPTPAVLPFEALPPEVGHGGTGLVIQAGGITLHLGTTLLIDFLGQSGPYLEGLQLKRDGFELPLLDGTRCYGLGEKTGYLDHRGRRFQMYNTDDPSPHLENLDPMYVSIPWLVLFREGRVCGLFLDDPGRSTWDLGRTDPDLLTAESERGELDLYLVAGPSFEKLLERFSGLTGRMPMPPRWALGYQQSRWSYPSAEEILRVAAEYRRREIPCDVLYADIDYMDGYRVFTWDPERFPDPRGLTDTLRADGFKLVPIIDPGVKIDKDFPVYQDGLEKEVFCRRDDQPYTGEVWPGLVHFPDFFRPEVRSWWGEQHKKLLRDGVAGIWNDMNEPAVFDTPTHTMPEDVLHGDGVPHSSVHNLYGWEMDRATFEALSRLRPQERPFLLSRAGYAGIQRYAAVWTGDNVSLWPLLEQSLPMLMNLGLSGVPFVGADVGGFSADCSGELLARWTQLGAFYPFFRNHAAQGTRSQEPWVFGPAIERICRRYIRLRYELLPYLYTAFWRTSQFGMPLLRPLVFDFPNDPDVGAIFDQALVGPSLMVAPITRPQSEHRAVYFPEGEWRDFWTGEVISSGPGGQWQLVQAPLDRLPLFVRSGAVIPRGAWAPSIEQLDKERLELEVFPGPALFGDWYDDDGISFGFRSGNYAHWLFSGEMEGDRLRIRLEALHGGFEPPKTVSILIRGFREAEEVTLDGFPCLFVTTPDGLRIESSWSAGEWVLSGLR